MTEKVRLNWLDAAKAIGIFLVVFAHTPLPESLARVIYAFHMPLFFFFGGLTFQKTEISAFEFLKKKAFTYLVTYFSIAFFSFIFWFFVGRKFGTDALLNISPAHTFLGIFYATTFDNYMIFNGVLWFLPCYFLVQILFFFVLKIKSHFQEVLLVLLSAFGILYSYLHLNFSFPRFPWCLDSACIALGFFALAFYTKNFFFKEHSYSILKGILLLAVGIIIGFFSPRIDLACLTITHPINFYGASIFCITGFMLLVKKLPSPKAVLFIGKNTLGIFAFHYIAFSFLRGILVFVFKQELSIFENTIFLNFLFSVATILVLVPICIFLKKFTPWVLGQRK